MTTATTRSKTVRVIYRCKRHKRVVRRTFENVVTYERYTDHRGFQRTATISSDWCEDGERKSSQYYPSIECPDCTLRYGTRWPMRSDVIEGRVVDTVTCGAKCVNAVGPSCECPCGGENHGRNYENNFQVATA